MWSSSLDVLSSYHHIILIRPACCHWSQLGECMEASPLQASQTPSHHHHHHHNEHHKHHHHHHNEHHKHHHHHHHHHSHTARQKIICLSIKEKRNLFSIEFASCCHKKKLRVITKFLQQSPGCLPHSSIRKCGLGLRTQKLRSNFPSF